MKTPKARLNAEGVERFFSIKPRGNRMENDEQEQDEMMVPKTEQVLEAIRELLVDNNVDAKDVILITEQLKIDAILTLTSALVKGK